MQQDSTIRENVENVEINYPETKAHFRAKALLKLTDGIGNTPNFLIGNNAMMIQSNSQESNTVIDLHQDLTVNVYPNPSTGVVYFDYPGKQAGEMLIELYNLEGKLMTQKHASQTNGERIDLSSLKKGFYLAKVKIDGMEVQVVKIELF